MNLIQLNCIKGFTPKKRDRRSGCLLAEVILPKVKEVARREVSHNLASVLEHDFKETVAVSDGIIVAHYGELVSEDLPTAVQGTDGKRDADFCEFFAKGTDFREVCCHDRDLSGLEGFLPFLYTILAYFRRLVKGFHRANYEQIVNNL